MTHRMVQVLQLQELPALLCCISDADLLLVYHQQIILTSNQLHSVLVQHLCRTVQLVSTVIGDRVPTSALANEPGIHEGAQRAY